MSRGVQTNWAGNYTYQAVRWHEPETVAQVQDIVARSAKLRVIGSRHSFNGIADTSAELVSLGRLNRVLGIDPLQRTVTVEGGIRYGELAVELHAAGYALHNLASLPHISVAGACATATHGSGDGNGNLATSIRALELVTADGDLVRLSRATHGDSFDGALVGLGGLGVVTGLTLAIEPTFDIRQQVYEQLPFATLEAEFDAITASAYSVSLFTDWQGEAVQQVWLKQRMTDGMPVAAPTFFGATAAPVDRHPIGALAALNCTPQLGVPGPWHERLPHFRLGFAPASGAELQSEYFVPRQHAVAAVRAVRALRAQLAPVLLISEIRTIAADTLWLSPCYGQPCVGLHFSWPLAWDTVRQVLPLIEQALAPFAARPHWGKLFTTAPATLQACYPRLIDFQRLLESFDPTGTFCNPFLTTYIFGAASEPLLHRPGAGSVTE